ncbi:DUF5682 family protein [Rugosimonospora acidiphila]|uniref:DUF5682 family protein n=1 Tax=Rugosimonospora acidiphila TaxID=556531 RepID=A0ABP9SF99_9ACTN
MGVRHHSPACARLVADTIDALRPAHVLVEGPADLNDRMDELLLGHALPVAVFTSYRDGERTHASWSPLCAYSPEWVALESGRAAGAQVRFVDLPAWHPAFARRENRYADAEERYHEATVRLCAAFGMDNADTLWDHLVEAAPVEGLGERLDVYFEMLRGDADASASDLEREAYMAGWIRAAAARRDGPVLVVCGGFHRPALQRLCAEPTDPAPPGEPIDPAPPGEPTDPAWPEVPWPPADATGTSYLVPYSFKRLDAFHGYQSGMPSPEFYQRVWEGGPVDAARGLTEAVVLRLRQRGQPVSTADLIAARTMAEGLARVRGHSWPARADVLDGLVSALVGEAMEVPLPWAHRGRLAAGTHPVVVEMVAALAGDRVGRLHPDTPLPPLVGQAMTELARLGLDADGSRTVELTDDTDRERSRTMHRLRVLGVPGFIRDGGPRPGADPALTERWRLSAHDDRLVALIEAGAYGPTLAEAAAAILVERAGLAAGHPGAVADVLFDAALCGIIGLADRIVATLRRGIGTIADLGDLGRVLAVALGLWRHDRLFDAARSPVLGAVIAEGVTRGLWLAEGVHGGPAPADPNRLTAIVAIRDAVRHAGSPLRLDPDAVLAVMGRIAADATAPPDLRGAAFGVGWSLGSSADAGRAVRGASGPATLGDWLAGLFSVAREEAIADDGLLEILDGLVGAMTETDFLVGLPALRQAFAYFPPRERQAIAEAMLARRGINVPARGLLRLGSDPMRLARARELDAYVDDLLTREGLVTPG